MGQYFVHGGAGPSGEGVFAFSQRSFLPGGLAFVGSPFVVEGTLCVFEPGARNAEQGHKVCDGRVILCLCDFCAGGAGAGLAEFQQVVKVEGCIDGKAVVAWVYALDQAVEGEIDDALVGVGDLSAELDHNLLDVSFDVVGFPGLKVNEHHSGVDVDIVGGDAKAGPVLLADAVHHAANDLAFKVGVVEFHEAVSDDGVAVYVKDSFAGFRQELGKEQSGELACAPAVLLYAVELGGYLAGGNELDVPVVLGG